MNSIKYVDLIVGENGRVPYKKYAGDAGFDLVVAVSADIPPHQNADIHTNIRINMPTGIFGRIIGRSSTLRKHGLIVNEGIIDNGYNGELFINVHNLRDEVFHVKQGMRLAQILFHKIEDIRWCLAASIEDVPWRRNGNGFGSTGE